MSEYDLSDAVTD